jgi:hypothetical protein
MHIKKPGNFTEDCRALFFAHYHQSRWQYIRKFFRWFDVNNYLYNDYSMTTKHRQTLNS